MSLGSCSGRGRETETHSEDRVTRGSGLVGTFLQVWGGFGEELGKIWKRGGSGCGKVQRTGFRADDNSCGCWDVRGHVGLRSPAVLLWEGQGRVGVGCHRGPAHWRRVPLSVCLSWASRPSATRVGSGAGPDDALGAPETGGAGEGGAAAVSAPPPAVCPPLLARCDRDELGAQVPAVGNGESEPVEKAEETLVSLAQRESQVKTGPSDG